jgi:hypothetical protein
MDTVLLSRPAYVRRADAQFNAFRQKVIDDGGTLETPFETKRLLRKLAQEDVLDDVTIGLVAGAYKAGKWYSFKGSDMDVVRATSGTRVNRSGVLTTEGNNIVRADYNGGVLKGNNVEPSATNLLRRSEEFDNASWTPTRATISPNATTAPDGNTVADKLIEDDTASASHFVGQGVTTSSGQVTYSCFAKKGERDWVRLVFFADSSNRQAYFNLNSGTIGTVSSGVTAKIKEYSNGWFRASITYNVTTGGTFIYSIALAPDDNTGAYTGDGTSGLFIWGAQLETGSVATSYIKTTDATATRNADNISKTGISSEIGQTEGAILVEVDLRELSNRTLINLSIDDANGTTRTQNRVALDFTGFPTFRYRVIDSNVEQCNITGSVVAGVNKILAIYKTNEFRAYINGAQIGSTDTSGTIPSLGRAYIGQNIVSTADTFFNDHIRSATIFDKAIPEATAIRLTT